MARSDHVAASAQPVLNAVEPTAPYSRHVATGSAATCHARVGLGVGRAGSPADAGGLCSDGWGLRHLGEGVCVLDWLGVDQDQPIRNVHADSCARNVRTCVPSWLITILIAASPTNPKRRHHGRTAIRPQHGPHTSRLARMVDHGATAGRRCPGGPLRTFDPDDRYATRPFRASRAPVHLTAIARRSA